MSSRVDSGKRGKGRRRNHVHPLPRRYEAVKRSGPPVRKKKVKK